MIQKLLLESCAKFKTLEIKCRLTIMRKLNYIKITRQGIINNSFDKRVDLFKTFSISKDMKVKGVSLE